MIMNPNFNMVKMELWRYRVSVIPIKIPVGFSFLRNSQADSKIQMEIKRSRSQNSLERTVRGFAFQFRNLLQSYRNQGYDENVYI